MTDIIHLIQHPERMDKETLYDLRSLLALYPYYQPARLLMLQNLYLLHDATFDEELRKAAIYITQRKKIFDLVEARHYTIKKVQRKESKEEQDGNRTLSLIDNFLENIPEEETEKKTNRKPSPADAAYDYVSYLLEIENEEEKTRDDIPQLKGQNLIDNFIFNEGGKMQLQEDPTFVPQMEEKEPEEEGEGYFTETLAKIYVKQGRYDKALKIIKRLNLNYPKKNAYFADQIRFLEKLIINNKQK